MDNARNAIDIPAATPSGGAERWFLLGEDDRPLPIPDTTTWGLAVHRGGWAYADRCRVAVDPVPGTAKGVAWTEFVGVDRGIAGDPPRPWATSVLFTGHPALDVVRCAHYAERSEAAAGHARVLEDIAAHLASCPGGCRAPWEAA